MLPWKPSTGWLFQPTFTGEHTNDALLMLLEPSGFAGYSPQAVPLHKVHRDSIRNAASH